MHDQRDRILETRLGVGQRKIENALGFRDTSRATDRTAQDRSWPACADRARPPPRRRQARPAARRSYRSGFCATRRRRKSAGPRVGARSAPTSADDSVRPPGRPRMILSDATSAVTSSEFGRIATPWIEFEQRQLDEILPLDEAANRRRRRDHHHRIAGVGIDEPMQKAGSGQRHGDIGKRGIGDVAYRHQRLRRRPHRVGKCKRPVRAAWSSPVSEGICGRLRRMRIACPLSSGKRLTSAMTDAALAADRLDIDRLCGIEHQPHRIGATKQCRRAWRRQRKTSRSGRSLVRVAPATAAPSPARRCRRRPGFGLRFGARRRLHLLPASPTVAARRHLLRRRLGLRLALGARAIFSAPSRV